jgi:sphinganine-1-phosphate aldolase
MNKEIILKYLGYAFIIKSTYDIIKFTVPMIKKSFDKLPIIQKKKQKEQNNFKTALKSELNKELDGNKLYLEIPEKNLSEDEINLVIDKLKKLQSYDINKGRVSGMIYFNNPKLDSFLNKNFLPFFRSNPLHTDTFPALRKMEAEIVSMTKNLFNGNQNTCGSFTSGGTESILLACKTYRDLAYNTGIENPEIIISDTAHASYKKAANYFKIKLIIIPSNEEGLYDLKKLKKNINNNTILIVTSAPSYNYGLIDQISEINKIVLDKNINLHVDACLGSFLLNFVEDEIIDFRLDGVTSISADLHKYGGSPKGASIILYKNKDLMKYQYFIDENWTGGIYATPTIFGSRNGNIVAHTWMTLMYIGMNGYKGNYEKIMNLKNYFIDQIKKIEELFIYGNPKLSIVSVGSEKIDVLYLTSKLKDKKWNLNTIQNPNGFHLCITLCHSKEIIDNLIIDIKDIISKMNEDTKKNNGICVYGTTQEITNTEIVRDVVVEYLHCIQKLE